MFKANQFYYGLISMVTLVSTSAFASGGEASGAHQEAHISNWWNMSPEINSHAPALGWVIITFLIFLALIYFSSRKEVKNTIERRADDIENAIKEAQKAKEAALAIKAKYDQKLQDLDGDIDQLKAEFEERGAKEKQRILESAEAATQKILKDTSDTMAAEIQRAKVSLKEEASKLAFEIAEEKIKQAINAEDAQRLQANFIQDVMN